MNKDAWKKQFVKTNGRQPTLEEFTAAQKVGFSFGKPVTSKKSKTLGIGIGVGVLVAGLIGGGLFILGDKEDTSDKASAVTSSEVVKESTSSESSSSESKPEKKELPDLTGNYVSNEGTKATISKIGNQAWKLSYKTSEGQVYGTFKTNWKHDGASFKAAGKLSKLDDQFEFDYVAKASPSKPDEPIEKITIELLDGNPDHSMTFTNHSAADMKKDDRTISKVEKATTFKDPSTMDNQAIIDYVQLLDWKHRAALIAVGAYKHVIEMHDVEDIKYSSRGAGDIGPYEKSTSVDNVQGLVGTDKVQTGGRYPNRFDIAFGKITDGNYVTYLRDTNGAGAHTDNVNVVGAYREYWNDPLVEKVSNMIVEN